MAGSVTKLAAAARARRLGRSRGPDHLGFTLKHRPGEVVFGALGGLEA